MLVTLEKPTFRGLNKEEVIAGETRGKSSDGGGRERMREGEERERETPHFSWDAPPSRGREREMAK